MMNDAIRMERIKPNMNLEQMLTVMAEGNPGALVCMVGLLRSGPTGFMDIMYLDTLGIYGAKIYMLWNDSCEQNMCKFKQTLWAFRQGKFTREQIHENLMRVRAQPFI